MGYTTTIEAIDLYTDQTVYLAVNSVPIRVWFEGSGTTYTVHSAEIRQGSVVIPLTVNGKASFSVPTLGRWVYLTSISGLTIPGYATLRVCVTGEITIIGMSGPSNGTVTGEDEGVATAIAGEDDLPPPPIPYEYEQRYFKFPFINDCTSLDDLNYSITYSFDKPEECIVDGDSVKLLAGYKQFGYVVGNVSISNMFNTMPLPAYIFELTMKCDQLPVFDDVYWNQGSVELFTYVAGNTNLWLEFRRDGLWAFGTTNDYWGELVGPGWVKCNAEAEYQTWKFVVYTPHGGTPLVEIFLDGVSKGIFDILDTEEGSYTGFYLNAQATYYGNCEIHLKDLNWTTPWWADYDITEVISTCTITVSDNAEVNHNDTLTFTINDKAVVYTFKSILTGAENEIFIGATDEITATNINAVINASFYGDRIIASKTGTVDALAILDAACEDADGTYDLEFVGGDYDTIATGTYTVLDGLITAVTLTDGGTGYDSSPVVKVNGIIGKVGSSISDICIDTKIYISEDVAVTTTSSGITVGAVVKTVHYYSTKVTSQVPAFSGMSISSEHGTLGDVYHLSNIPSFTGASTCSHTAFIKCFASARGFMGSSDSFLPGCTSASEDADKIALMSYGSLAMQNLSGMISVAGDDDDVALLSTQWVARNIEYVTDVSLYGVTEYWADPRRTVKNRAGDCEDFAFLTATLMLNNAVAPDRVRVYMGKANGVGHAWVCYQRTIDDEWIILDATKG